jgi:hypothetical protein
MLQGNTCKKWLSGCVTGIGMEYGEKTPVQEIP